MFGSASGSTGTHMEAGAAPRVASIATRAPRPRPRPILGEPQPEESPMPDSHPLASHRSATTRWTPTRVPCSAPARAATDPSRPDPQHLPHARAPPEALEALAGVRQPRAREVDAAAARARARDPAHRLAVPRRYEWGQHVVIGRRPGLSDDEIRAHRRGPDAPGWSAHRRALLRAVDELHDDAFLTDATWSGALAQLDKEQLIDCCSPSASTAWCRWRSTRSGCSSTTGWRGSAVDGVTFGRFYTTPSA